MQPEKNVLFVGFPLDPEQSFECNVQFSTFTMLVIMTFEIIDNLLSSSQKWGILQAMLSLPCRRNPRTGFLLDVVFACRCNVVYFICWLIFAQFMASAAVSIEYVCSLR